MREGRRTSCKFKPNRWETQATTVNLPIPRPPFKRKDRCRLYSIVRWDNAADDNAKSLENVLFGPKRCDTGRDSNVLKMVELAVSDQSSISTFI